MFKGKRMYCLSTWLHVWLSSENGKNGSFCGEDRIRDLFFLTAPMVSFVPVSLSEAIVQRSSSP